MTGRTLLFDLDGTLTDPRPGIVGCIRHALDRLGAPCPEDDALATFIGPPLRRTFATLLATTDAGRIEAAMGLYRERFGRSGLYENRVYDGIRAMLDEVRGRGAVAYVVTAKPTVYAERIVRHFALDHHFARVYGVELDGRFDDKAELLAHVLARERLPPDGAVMIGDRAADMVAARACGVRGIGVLWGYGSEQELREAGADRLCADPLELIACLAR